MVGIECNDDTRHGHGFNNAKHLSSRTILMRLRIIDVDRVVLRGGRCGRNQSKASWLAMIRYLWHVVDQKVLAQQNKHQDTSPFVGRRVLDRP
jgi:hypothetical protein